MSKRYKSLVGILFFLVEVAAWIAMIYALGNTFDSAWQLAAMFAGVIAFTVVGVFFAWVADSWIGFTFALVLASAVSSPFFYYVWSQVGWPAGGFLCITAVYATANVWRKEAEAEAA